MKWRSNSSYNPSEAQPQTVKRKMANVKNNFMLKLSAINLQLL
jgi:hypothetical protein